MFCCNDESNIVFQTGGVVARMNENTSNMVIMFVGVNFADVVLAGVEFPEVKVQTEHSKCLSEIMQKQLELRITDWRLHLYEQK